MLKREMECPNCGTLCQIDSDDLPPDTYDSDDFECSHCGHIFDVGWYVE